jgi:hypothetical protein
MNRSARLRPAFGAVSRLKSQRTSSKNLSVSARSPVAGPAGLERGHSFAGAASAPAAEKKTRILSSSLME